MNVSSAQNPLGYEKISTLLRRFAVPSVVAMLVSSLYNIVDQIYIGNSVGYLGNAATNVAFPLVTISLAISLLIGIGGATRFSLHLGMGNHPEAAKSVGTAVTVSAVSGILYGIIVYVFREPLLVAFGATDNSLPLALEYVRITALGMPFLIVTNVISNFIRADGSPGYSMLCMVSGAVVNTVLDPIFIYDSGLGMGVAGAALATVISQVISFVFALVYLFRFRTVKPNAAGFVPSLSRCRAIASLGMSSSINQVAICIVQVVLNNTLRTYGAMSEYGADIPISAFGIVMKVNSIFISVFVGISQGSQPIIGYNYGAGRADRSKAVFSLASKIAFAVSVLAFAIFMFFPKYVVAVFGHGDALYERFAVKTMRVFLSTVLFNGVQLLICNYFSAVGKPVKGMILSAIRQVALIVPLILIFSRLFGLEGVLYSAPVNDTVAFIISAAFILREFSLPVYKKTAD